MTSSSRRLLASDLNSVPSQDETTIQNDPPTSNYQDENDKAEPDFKLYGSWQDTLEGAAQQGQLGQIRPEKVGDLTPYSASQLLTVLGCSTDDYDDKTHLPNIQEWRASDVQSYVNRLRNDMARNEEDKAQFNSLSNCNTEMKLDILMASALNAQTWTPEIRKSMVSKLNSYTQDESFRQVSVAAPQIANRIFEEVKSRVGDVIRENPSEAKQVLTPCQNLKRIRELYVHSFRTFDEDTLKRMADKLDQFRDANDTHGMTRNMRVQKDLLNSGEVSIRRIPFRDSRSYRVSKDPNVTSVGCDSEGNILITVQSDNTSKASSKNVRAEETKFGISKNQMMDPRERQRADTFLTEQLDKLNYTASRNRDPYKRVEELTRNSIELASDGHRELLRWNEQYMKTRNINEDEIDDHVKMCSEENVLHTKEESEKASNLREEHGRLEQGFQDYLQYCHKTYSAIHETIEDVNKQIDGFKYSKDHLNSKMYEVYSRIAEADKLRLELYGMLMDTSCAEEFPQKKQEYSDRVTKNLTEAEELLKPFEKTPLDKLKSWRDFKDSSQEGKEEYRKILAELEPNWKSPVAPGSWADEVEDQDWTDRVRGGEFSWQQLLDNFEDL